MYAILFDIDISVLEQNYGKSYTQAFFEIEKLLENYNFYKEQEGVYFSKIASKKEAINSIEVLSKKDWFLLSVKKVQTFKIEDWNDFTPLIKEKMRELVFQTSR